MSNKKQKNEPIIETVNEPEMEKLAEEEIEEHVKAYTFRKLNAPDMFLMFKIISKIGINEFMTCFENGNVMKVLKDLSVEEKTEKQGEMIAAGAIVLEMVNIILGNVHKCENEIYALLAQTSDKTVEEITADGNAVMFVEMVIDFLKKDEFPDFIGAVSKLFK
jgi:hypothetical protein